VSRSKLAAALALCIGLALPGQVDAKRGSSLVLVGESEPGFLEPRLETPPYSPVLDDANYALDGLGERQDQRFQLSKTAKGMLALFGPAPRTVFNEHNALYCYVSSRPGDRTAVIFSLDPDALWSVSVHADKSAIIQAGKRCRATPAVSSAVRTPGGLRLGMTREEVLAMFGEPHRVIGRRTIGYASYRLVRPGEFPQGFVVSRVQRWIEIYLGENGRVDGFFILANDID
jgi:hypothetical protein